VAPIHLSFSYFKKRIVNEKRVRGTEVDFEEKLVFEKIPPSKTDLEIFLSLHEKEPSNAYMKQMQEAKAQTSLVKGAGPSTSVVSTKVIQRGHPREMQFGISQMG